MEEAADQASLAEETLHPSAAVQMKGAAGGVWRPGLEAPAYSHSGHKPAVSHLLCELRQMRQ